MIWKLLDWLPDSWFHREPVNWPPEEDLPFISGAELKRILKEKEKNQ